MNKPNIANMLETLLCDVSKKTFDDHLEDVQMVLKLNFKKCNWFRKEAQYLGHILSEDSYRVEGANDEVIDRPKEVPKTVGELRSLLGFIG